MFHLFYNCLIWLVALNVSLFLHAECQLWRMGAPAVLSKNGEDDEEGAGLASEADEPRGQLITMCTNNMRWPCTSGQKALKVHTEAKQTAPKKKKKKEIRTSFEVRCAGVCLQERVHVNGCRVEVGAVGAGSLFQKQAWIPIGLNSMKLFDISILECL